MSLSQTITARLVLPAHAGVIPATAKSVVGVDGITRTCGGDPECDVKNDWVKVYYPHMRG